MRSHLVLIIFAVALLGCICLSTIVACLSHSEVRHYDNGAVWTQTITYSYDAAGNRTSKRFTGPGVDDTYTENIDPTFGYKLTSVDGPGADDSTFGYDAGGRLTRIDRNSDVQTLTYNSAGQVTGVLDVGGSDVDHTYECDALGRRTRATDTSCSEQRYLIAPAAQRLGAGALDVDV